MEHGELLLESGAPSLARPELLDSKKEFASSLRLLLLFAHVMRLLLGTAAIMVAAGSSAGVGIAG